MHIEVGNIIKMVSVTAILLLYLPKNDEDLLANPAGMVSV